MVRSQSDDGHSPGLAQSDAAEINGARPVLRAGSSMAAGGSSRRIAPSSDSDGNEMTGLPSTIASKSADRGRNPDVDRNRPESRPGTRPLSPCHAHRDHPPSAPLTPCLWWRTSGWGPPSVDRWWGPRGRRPPRRRHPDRDHTGFHPEIAGWFYPTTRVVSLDESRGWTSTPVGPPWPRRSQWISLSRLVSPWSACRSWTSVSGFGLMRDAVREDGCPLCVGQHPEQSLRCGVPLESAPDLNERFRHGLERQQGGPPLRCQLDDPMDQAALGNVGGVSHDKNESSIIEGYLGERQGRLRFELPLRQCCPLTVESSDGGRIWISEIPGRDVSLGEFQFGHMALKMRLQPPVLASRDEAKTRFEM